MVILFVAVLVVVVIFSIASGSTALMLLLPLVLVVAGGGAFLTFVLREGQARRDQSVRQMPTDHLRRQMYMALRPQRRASRQQQLLPQPRPDPDPDPPE